MIYRTVLNIVLLIVLSLLLVSCFDEKDCATCPPTAPSDRLSVSGSILFSGYSVAFRCKISSTEAETIEDIDSVLVDGRAVEISPWYNYTYPTCNCQLAFIDSSRSSGDTMEVAIYARGELAVCDVILLDYYDDRVIFAEYDTVEVNTEIVVEWSSVTNANMYIYEAMHSYDSAGYRVWLCNDFKADTFLTIPAEDNQFNGLWTVRVSAVSISESSGSNGGFVGSNLVMGNIFGRSAYTETQIFVGTGDPNPDASAKPAPPATSELEIDRIIEKWFGN